MGKNAPALTVASLAITITNRPATRSKAGHNPGGRCAPPLLIHAEGSKKPQFQEFLAGIKQQGQPFANRQALFAMLRLDGFSPPTLADEVLLLTESE